MALVALVRLLALALGAYLLLVFGAGMALRLLRLRALVAGVDRITPPTLREILDRATGVAAAGAVALAGVAGSAPPVAAAPRGDAIPVHGPPATTHGPPVTLRGLAGPQPDPTPTTTTVVPSLPLVTPPATLPPERQRITQPQLGDIPDEVVADLFGPPSSVAPLVDPPPADSPSDTPPHAREDVEVVDGSTLPQERRRITSDRAGGGMQPPDSGRVAKGTGAPVQADPPIGSRSPANPDAAAAAVEAGRATAPSPGGGEAPTWKVEVGDHFWSIAERLLADNWGRRPSAFEVDPYWRVLIEANRDRLVDGDNADLLLPGQLLVLPPVPVRPAA